MMKFYEYTINGQYSSARLQKPEYLAKDAVLIRVNDTFADLQNSPEYLADLAEQQAAQMEVTKADLWEAATGYREKRISAEGIIELKPFEKTHTKSGEIRLWIQAIWSLYYQKKAELEQGKSTSLDFSELGEMPHSFLEAMAEIEEN
jgi:hypothetical protein